MKTGRHANENSGIGALLLIRAQPGTTSGRKTITTTAKPLPAIDLAVSSFGSRTPRFIKHEESMSALQFNTRDAVGGKTTTLHRSFFLFEQNAG